MRSQLFVHNGEHPKLPNSIRFVCISDTHNKTDSLKVPPGDVLLHAGDFSQVGLPDEVTHFNNFLSTLNHTYKIVIAGNHDITFDTQNYEKLTRDQFQFLRNEDFPSVKSLLNNCIYLEDSATEVFGYKIYGSPWQPEFFDWGFNLPRGPLIAEKWSLIPNDTDILITHGPPMDKKDKCSDGFSAGCVDLKNRIEEIKPLVHLFGHIHEGYGVDTDENTTYINASVCNLRYQPIQKPFVFDLPVKTA